MVTQIFVLISQILYEEDFKNLILKIMFQQSGISRECIID